MRIAIPTAGGRLCMHFGHCDTFTIVDVDAEQCTILATEQVDAPPHQPGLLPPWLAEKDVKLVIAGGMGQRAQQLFTQQGIAVIAGAPADTPEQIVNQYLANSLTTGANACDH